MLHTSRITKIRFRHRTSKNIVEESYALINSPDLFQGSRPVAKGVYDAHLGTAGHDYSCSTCDMTKGCTGHHGHIHLNQPVYSPIAIGDIRAWLKCICWECGKCIVKVKQSPNALTTAMKLIGNTPKRCIHCSTMHPQVRRHVSEPLGITVQTDDKNKPKYNLLPHVAKKIFQKVAPETVAYLGRSQHPSVYIWDDLDVTPVTIRPDTRKIGGGKSAHDDLTTMTQVIIKYNDSLPIVTPADITPDYEQHMFNLMNACNDLLRANGENAPSSIFHRIKGKNGRQRKNLLGKRVFVIARSTIVGDPTLEIDELGIPSHFARTLYVEEIVNDFNREQLTALCIAGLESYPGAQSVERDGRLYALGSSRTFELRNGDKIRRDLIDGDYVQFNRQPSLMNSNLTGMRAKIIRNPDVKTFLMNVLICKYFNADFDGDQMNMIICTTYAGRNEIANLSSAPNWLITQANSSPALGQVDDSIVMLADLTRTGTVYDRYHAMSLFSNCTYKPVLPQKEEFTGRELVSYLLDKTPINLSRETTWYNEKWAPYIKYNPDDIKLVIENGKILKGVLDKKNIGAGASGGVYHVIATEYSPRAALDVMYNMQQMAIAHTYLRGFSIGILDFMVPMSVKEQIDNITSEILKKSDLIMERLINGELVSPIGKTIHDYYEELQINTLSVFDDFLPTILSALATDFNQFFKLIGYGSKGSIENLFNMMSGAGQKLINGERIRDNFEFHRTTKYSKRYGADRGYLANSYLSGMTRIEYIYNAMTSRFDLISKALSTSVTGQQNREGNKSLESNTVNNFRMVMKGPSVVQFLYGEDGLDPRYLENVKFPTAFVSDKEFETFIDDVKHNEDLVQELTEDRQWYRDTFLKIESCHFKEVATDKRLMPVNVQRIVDKIVATSPKVEATKSDIDKMIGMINDTCARLPYVFINEIQEARRSEVPEHFRYACKLMTILFRSVIVGSITKLNPDMLQMVINTTRVRYHKCLIAPGFAAGIVAAQSFSEPLTQYMLDAHHRSATGGTSKGAMVTSKELLGARSADKIVESSMLIALHPSIAHDEAKVAELANNIEVMKFNQFINDWQIFYEQFGKPVHSDYKHEEAIIKEFLKYNPATRIPSDLTKWCIRINLDKTALILKNMSVETITAKIRKVFPETFIVFTNENHAQAIIRVYIRSGAVKDLSLASIQTYRKNLFETTIRGIEGITSASVVTSLRSVVDETGAVVRDRSYMINTIGSNLFGIARLRDVDMLRTVTSSIREIERSFNVHAARQCLRNELHALVEKCSYRHNSIYSDDMALTGIITSIGLSGVKSREQHNILLRMGFSNPAVALEEAATRAVEDKIYGFTGALVTGTVPHIGTLYNQVLVNREFVRTNVKSTQDKLDELL